jgi:Holliday junction resolvase RusA-like endonuclease
MTLHLTIPVVPVAQPRQRHAIRGGHSVNYTPTDSPVNAYKAAVQLAAGQAITAPIAGPLAVTFRFYLPRPQSLMKRKSPDGAIPHTSKPDLDNLIKSTADCLSGIAWVDDRQIYSYAGSSKWYAEKHGRARVEIIAF